MAADFTIKQHDLLKSLDATLKDAAGAVNISTATQVVFKMKAVNDGGIAVDDLAQNLDDNTTPNMGKVRYLWTAGDTDEPGMYHAEFEVTIGGKKLTFPNNSYFTVQITPDIS